MNIEDLLGSNRIVVAKTTPVEQLTDLTEGPFHVHSECLGAFKTEPVIQLPAIKELSLTDARKLANFLLSVCDQYES